MTQPNDTDHTAKYLEQAVELATRNVGEGGGPFGALVVTADGRVHEGVNRVTRDNDPTAHAEVVAIRAAAAATANYDLHGAVLYASCEPCPLCLASALWARIDRVYFAADRHGAACAGTRFVLPQAGQAVSAASIPSTPFCLRTPPTPGMARPTT